MKLDTAQFSAGFLKGANVGKAFNIVKDLSTLKDEDHAHHEHTHDIQLSSEDKAIKRLLADPDAKKYIEHALTHAQL